MEKSGTHRLRWEEGENNNIEQQQSHHNIVRCGDALLTGCYVPCVPSREEEGKHSSQGSLTQHTSLEHVEKSGTHPLRWEEGENNNIEQQQLHHNVVRRCGDALLTICYVPCVPSSEEERKHNSQGSLTWHTSLGHVEKSGAHPLRWRKEKTATCNNHNHITMSLEMWECITHKLFCSMCSQ